MLSRTPGTRQAYKLKPKVAVEPVLRYLIGDAPARFVEESRFTDPTARSRMSLGITPIADGVPCVIRPDDLLDLLPDPVACMTRLHERFGNIAACKHEGQTFVFAFGPEYHKPFFTDGETYFIFSRFPGPRGSSHRRFGRGLFSQNGEEHKNFRRLLMPPFKKEAVISYYDVLAGIIRDMIGQWKVGTTIDLFAHVKELMLKITSRILFGVDDQEVAHSVEHLFEEWLDTYHLVNISNLLPVKAPSGCEEALLEIADRLYAALQELIELRRSQGLEGHDVLALMLRAHAKGLMSNDDLIGQTLTIFNASYHTTTSSLSFLLFLMAQHPEAMRRLNEEFQSIPDPTSLGTEELDRLKELDCVVNESLRILPPVLYIPRMIMRPTVLGAYPVQPGTMVMISPYIAHRLPEIFPEPKKFDPQRWKRTNPTPWEYIPFGGGHRMCLGAPMATQIIKLGALSVLQKFRLEVVPGASLDRHGTMTFATRKGIPVVLHPADGKFAVSPISGNLCEMVDFDFPRPVSQPETISVVASRAE